MNELRRCIRLMLESDEILDEDDVEEGEPKDEASTVASIRGYTAPLGSRPKVPGSKSRKREPWEAYAQSFARAKPVK